MNYDFPIIRHIDDVLPYIEGYDDFFVAEKDGYKVINYIALSSDTFRPFRDDMTYEERKGNAIRRECRGLIFDDNGYLISRPFHKFFNVNEREETLSKNVDFSNSHVILEKLDGSMIRPMIVNNELIFATKMGNTDIAKMATRFVDNSIVTNYIEFCFGMLDIGFTPIFEYVSMYNRIVVNYKENLILTAIRHNQTGNYLKYYALKSLAEESNIPFVKAYEGNAENMDMLMKHTKDLVDAEGYVVRFNSGHMIKVKGDWYVAIHKAKDELLYERNVVEMFLDGKIDDISAFLPEEDALKLKDFCDKLHSRLMLIRNEIASGYKDNNHYETKAEFAKNFAAKNLYSAVLFRLWDEGYEPTIVPSNINEVYYHFEDFVRKHLNSNTKYAMFKEKYLGNFGDWNG